MKSKIFVAVLVFLSLGQAYSTELNDVLPDPYPEVYQNVTVLPFDPHGWYGHHAVFRKLIRKSRAKVAIEVGSWLGASTRDIAKLLPGNGVVYAVDTWKGSVEHQPGEPYTHPAIHYLFQQFLSNVIHEGLQGKIIPVRAASIEAAERLAQLNIKADFIYMDAAHDYNSVYQDLRAWYPFLREGGIFCGDDYTWPGVAQAVQQFAQENNLHITADYLWRLVRKN